MSGPGDLTPEQHALIGMLQQDAVNRDDTEHSVACNPHDPAFFMLLEGSRTVPVVHREGCYICGDPEFAIMGLPLCQPCPACLRLQQPCTACQARGWLPDGSPCPDCLATGMLGLPGHIPADDVTCDECGHEHGPEDYDEDGLITGIPRARAEAIRDAGKPRKRP